VSNVVSQYPRTETGGDKSGFPDLRDIMEEEFEQDDMLSASSGGFGAKNDAYAGVVLNPPKGSAAASASASASNS